MTQTNCLQARNAAPDSISYPAPARWHSPTRARQAHVRAHGRGHAHAHAGERPRVRRQRTGMRGEPGRKARATSSVPVRMSRIKQIGIPAKADYILEKVKCHDIIVFREGKA
ncbi:MAG: hypothetical protein NTY37_06760 [Methanothrix sp.]|nr:hypothetical protein [Methanothrix sp.]